MLAFDPTQRVSAEECLTHPFLTLLVHYPEDFQDFQSHTHNSYNQIWDQDHHIPPLLVHYLEHYYLSRTHRILDHIPPALVLHDRKNKNKQNKVGGHFSGFITSYFPH